MIEIVAEIGINHCGNIKIAKQLIDIASISGCTRVKFQKRNPDICVPENQKKKEKIVPWRKKSTTYLQYKKDIEFSFEDYNELDLYCINKSIKWFASVWDLDSANFMLDFCETVKIPSALLTNHELLDFCYENFDYRILSTGMSTEDEIEEAIKILDPQVIMHTNSVYPTPIDDLRLDYIKWLREKYPDKEIGYSNHYYGIIPLVASVLLNVNWIEFHVTLNHEMFGSDQLSSIEPSGIFKAVKGIRDLEKAIVKGYEPRKLYPGEEIKREVLRG